MFALNPTARSIHAGLKRTWETRCRFLTADLPVIRFRARRTRGSLARDNLGNGFSLVSSLAIQCNRWSNCRAVPANDGTIIRPRGSTYSEYSNEYSTRASMTRYLRRFLRAIDCRRSARARDFRHTVHRACACACGVHACASTWAARIEKPQEGIGVGASGFAVETRYGAARKNGRGAHEYPWDSREELAFGCNINRRERHSIRYVSLRLAALGGETFFNGTRR